MRKFHLIILLLGCQTGLSQEKAPWESPLKMAWSEDGITFSNQSIFQDSAGVPSAVRWKGDTLVCVFQWFRQPVNSPTWDRIAVKFSFDAGITWTRPVPVKVTGIPAGYQRPFDPALVALSNTLLRIYFSSSNGIPPGGLTSIVDTYSAISSDGVNYTFEPDARVDEPDRPVIDPAVISFKGTWHYAAPAGAPRDGAFHYTGSDGLKFTQQAKYSSDNFHNWTGNFTINGPDDLRFYGSGQKIWFNSSSDGFAWQGYTNTNLAGGDPSLVKISNTRYLAVYVGEKYSTGSSFKCGDTLVDPRDGKKYPTVLIGKYCWMKQNLNFGQMVQSIASTTLHSDMSDNRIPEKYAMNNNSVNLNIYGGLYEWNELMNYSGTSGGQGLCPPGWHVSTDEEWQNLISVSGGSLTSSSGGHGGNALKIAGEGSGAGTGTDLVGLSARHSGDRDGFGIFYGLGLRSIFWTSTRANQVQAYHYTLWAGNDTIQRLMLGSNSGFACRCVLNTSSTGIQEIRSPENQKHAYPNPFTSRINFFPESGNELYELINASGEIIWAGKYIRNNDFSGLAEGLYFLKVTQESSFQIFKLIKI